jgi:hypothetical protein
MESIKTSVATQPTTTKNITPISSIAEAHHALQIASPTTLIVCDIDDTILSPDQQTWWNIIFGELVHIQTADLEFIRDMQKLTKEFVASKQDTTYFSTLIGKIFSKTKFSIIEETFVHYLHELQKHHVPIITLSACDTGKSGPINSMQQWRFDDLFRHNLNFSATFDTQEISLPTFNWLPATPPAFYKGILLSSRYPKGPVLSAFFDAIQWRPEQIIFFDDREINCQTISDEMAQQAIACECFLYKKNDTNFATIDRDLIRFQFEHLVATDEFLDDNEARTLQLTQQQTHHPQQPQKEAIK